LQAKRLFSLSAHCAIFDVCCSCRALRFEIDDPLPHSFFLHVYQMGSIGDAQVPIAAAILIGMCVRLALNFFVFFFLRVAFTP
jgi:hypothetical protein